MLDRFALLIRERFLSCETVDDAIRVATNADIQLDDVELAAIALAIGRGGPSNPSSSEDLDKMLSSSHAQSISAEFRPFEKAFVGPKEVRIDVIARERHTVCGPHVNETV